MPWLRGLRGGGAIAPTARREESAAAAFPTAFYRCVDPTLPQDRLPASMSRPRDVEALALAFNAALV
jgi:hypothetical protein